MEIIINLFLPLSNFWALKIVDLSLLILMNTRIQVFIDYVANNKNKIQNSNI